MKYVVITPARNERDYIGATLDSMIAQTQRPLRWVIVSDGSTDDTDELVDTYRARYDWIELVRLPTHRNRNFASKVEGFNAGLARYELSFEVIASLDADIAFKPNYFEFLLQRLNADPRLGVAGTPSLSKETDTTTTDSPTSTTCQAPARCSGVDVLRISGGTSRSRAAASIGWPLRLLAGKDGTPGRLPK
jgi:glycosyltransferase involved in cell wall biosynthesis